MLFELGITDVWTRNPDFYRAPWVVAFADGEVVTVAAGGEITGSL